MSRAVTSPVLTRGRKRPATTGAPSIVGSAARPRAQAGTKRRASSASTSGTVGMSSAGTSAIPRKRARKTPNPISPPLQTAAAAPPTARRKVKPESSKNVPTEKRLARYIPSPSNATSERITRAFQQRLYLLDKKLIGDDPNSPFACHFNVLGSTGNVYEVKLQQRPACTCPDFPRSGLCKHILFVMLRVLKLDRMDPRVWQKALLKSEVNELLEIAATTDGVLASQSVRQRFQELQRSSERVERGDLNSAAAAAPSKPIQREITGDCPICYENMDDGSSNAKEPVVFCRVCGNNVHRDCFDRWTASKLATGGETTCIYCRAVWADPADAAAAVTKGRSSSDYVNLADVSVVRNLEELYPESHRWIGVHGARARGVGRGRGSQS